MGLPHRPFGGGNFRLALGNFVAFPEGTTLTRQDHEVPNLNLLLSGRARDADASAFDWFCAD